MYLNVAIIDDKAGNRNILKHKLLVSGQFTITVIAEDGSDFLEKMKALPQSDIPHVALMDLEMPNMDGVNTIALAASLYPNTKFVVLTIYDDEDKIFRAIKAGAFGYLLKEESGEKIAEVLLQMYESGAGPISPGIAHKILQLIQNNDLKIVQKPVKNADVLFDLTGREQEILQLLVRGLAYKEIGTHLNISTNTAKKHVINVYNKLHVNSRAQALHLAYNNGLL